jgi:hypothetical protein
MSKRGREDKKNEDVEDVDEGDDTSDDEVEAKEEPESKDDRKVTGLKKPDSWILTQQLDKLARKRLSGESKTTELELFTQLPYIGSTVEQVLDNYLYSLTLDYQKEYAQRQNKVVGRDIEKRRRINRVEHVAVLFGREARREGLNDEDMKKIEKIYGEYEKEEDKEYESEMKKLDEEADKRMAEMPKNYRLVERWKSRRSGLFKGKAKGQYAKFNRLKAVWEMPEPRPWKTDRGKMEIDLGEGVVLDWLTFNHWMRLLDPEHGWSLQSSWGSKPRRFALFDDRDNEPVVCYRRIPKKGYRWVAIRPNEYGYQIIDEWRRATRVVPYMWQESKQLPTGMGMTYCFH